MIRTGIIIGDSSVAAYLLFLLSEPADGGLRTNAYPGDYHPARVLLGRPGPGRVITAWGPRGPGGYRGQGRCNDHGLLDRRLITQLVTTRARGPHLHQLGTRSLQRARS